MAPEGQIVDFYKRNIPISIEKFVNLWGGPFGYEITKLFCTCPHPPLRQHLQPPLIRPHRLPIFPLPLLIFGQISRILSFSQRLPFFRRQLLTALQRPASGFTPGLRRFLLRFLDRLRPLLRFPTRPPFDQDAVEELGRRFVGRVLGDEAPLAGRFEYRGPVAAQLGLGSFQGGPAGVEAGELGFDGFDDAALFGEGGRGIFCAYKSSRFNPGMAVDLSREFKFREPSA